MPTPTNAISIERGHDNVSNDMTRIFLATRSNCTCLYLFPLKKYLIYAKTLY
jgi:hypothetical protein